MSVVTPPYSLIDEIANLKAQQGQNLAAGITGGVSALTGGVNKKQGQKFQAQQAQQAQSFQASQWQMDRNERFFDSFNLHGSFGWDDSVASPSGGGGGQ